MTSKVPLAICVVLAIALVASNAWWFLENLDLQVSLKYREQEARERGKALEQALAMLPAVAACADPTTIIAAARGAIDGEGSEFEKEGLTWIGSLGLSFDANGNLTHVAKNWDFSTAEP